MTIVRCDRCGGLVMPTGNGDRFCPECDFWEPTGEPWPDDDPPKPEEESRPCCPHGYLTECPLCGPM